MPFPRQSVTAWVTESYSVAALGRHHLAKRHRHTVLVAFAPSCLVADGAIALAAIRTLTLPRPTRHAAFHAIRPSRVHGLLLVDRPQRDATARSALDQALVGRRDHER